MKWRHYGAQLTYECNFPFYVIDFSNLKLFISSSQEPDSKRLRVDDSSAAAATAMTDAQANNSAYNYNWYQVGLQSEKLMVPEKGFLTYLTPHRHVGLFTVFVIFLSLSKWDEKTIPKLSSCFVEVKNFSLISSLLFVFFSKQQYGGWGQNSWGQYNQYAQYNQYYPPPPT